MLSTVENSKRIARNTGYLYIRLFLVTIINLIISRIVLKALGFEDFGIYNVVGSVVVLFGFLSNALRSASIRYLSVEIGKEDEQALNRVFAMVLNSHLLLAAILFVIIEGVGVWYINYHLEIAPERLGAVMWTFQFSLLTFVTGILQTPFAANIIAHEQMNYYAILSVIEACLKLSVAYLLLITPFDRLVSYAALIWMSSIVIGLGYVIYHKVKIPHCRYHKLWDGDMMKQFASYSGWSLFVNAADTGVVQLRAVFFQSFLGSIANAALGIANQVFNATTLVFGNFSTAFHPQIVKSYATGDKEYFMKLIFTTSKVSFFLFLLPALPMLINLPYLLELWLGDVPPLTAEYITAMFIYAFFDAFQAPMWNAVYATGTIRTHQLLMGIIKLLVIPLMWWALCKGDNGQWSILIWAIGNIVCAIVRTVYCHRLIDLDLWLYVKRVILPMAAVTLIALPVPLVLQRNMDNDLILLIASTLSAVSISLIASLYIGLTKKEREVVLSFIKHERN